MQMHIKHYLLAPLLLLVTACSNDDEGRLELAPPEAVKVQEVKKVYYAQQKQKKLKPLEWKTLDAFDQKLSSLRDKKDTLEIDEFKSELGTIKKLAAELSREKVPKGIRDPAQIIQLQNSLMSLANSEKASQAKIKEEVMMLLDGMNFMISRMQRQLELSNEQRAALDP